MAQRVPCQITCPEHELFHFFIPEACISSVVLHEIRHLIKVNLSDRKPSQQKNILKYIRGIFTFTVEAGLALRNPVLKITFRLGDKIKKVLSQQQEKNFLERLLSTIMNGIQYGWLLSTLSNFRHSVPVEIAKQ